MPRNALLIHVLLHFRILFIQLYLFVQKILEKNDAGDHFPLFATCLGFELITMIISQVSWLSHSFIIFHLSFRHHTIIFCVICFKWIQYLCYLIMFPCTANIVINKFYWISNLQYVTLEKLVIMLNILNNIHELFRTFYELRAFDNIL